MDISNSQALNVGKTDNSAKSNVSSVNKNNSDVKFSDELKNAKSSVKEEKNNSKDVRKEELNQKDKTDLQSKKQVEQEESTKVEDKDVSKAINGLNEVLDELTVLNQKDELSEKLIKKSANFDDNNKKEDFGLIDNNMNIQEPQDKINLQMGANMQFNSDAQPFAQFVQQDNKTELKTNAKDLAEEKSIMSTMEENIAIANKNMAMSKTKTVQNEQGIQKIDKKTELVVDTIVKYDSVVMDKADVEFFTNLVEKGIVDIKDISGAEKSARVSKALADLLAKAMENNKPVRIDFDNNISVIIKIDRAGKISADFLPSSQVAEAYLKENLPLLKQRFDDNNIDYNELNQRQRKQDNQEDKKKGRKDE